MLPAQLVTGHTRSAEIADGRRAERARNGDKAAR